MVINSKQLGIKIKALREKAGITQKQLSDYLSVDQSLISKFETGERSISSDMLENLAALFCYPVFDLISSEHVVLEYKFAFRTIRIETEDLVALSVINKIALNQKQMDTLAGGNIDDR